MNVRRFIQRVIGLSLLVGGIGIVLFTPQLVQVRRVVMRVVLWPVGIFANTGALAGSLLLPRESTELQELTNERDALVLENARLRTLEQENVELRALIDFTEREDYVRIAARIIGQSPELDVRTILLDRGADDGVDVGMPIIAQDGFFLGKVSRVGPRTATVILATDQRSRVAATLLNADHTIGLVEGGKGLGLVLRFIPQTEVVKTGTLAVTSGLEESVPRGLVIGRIERVIREPQEPFQTAAIQQLVQAQRNQIVAIITQKRAGDL